MAVCDICNRPGMGTIVSASDFRQAVIKGFNPLQAGLVPDVGSMFGIDSYAHWKESAISGATSRTDWSICADCMPQ